MKPWQTTHHKKSEKNILLQKNRNWVIKKFIKSVTKSQTSEITKKTKWLKHQRVYSNTNSLTDLWSQQADVSWNLLTDVNKMYEFSSSKFKIESIFTFWHTGRWLKTSPIQIIPLKNAHFYRTFSGMSICLATVNYISK